MLNKYARAFFTRVLTPFAALLLRRGVSPDAVTLVGTAGVMAGALVFYPVGQFFWGTVVITLFVFSDLVDGNMARQLGRSSRWGAFLDSTLDRVADAADLRRPRACGTRAGGDDLVLCAVTIFCLASGQVVSYTKARGESIGLPVNVNGLVERVRAAGDHAGAGGSLGLAGHFRRPPHRRTAADRPVGGRSRQPGHPRSSGWSRCAGSPLSRSGGGTEDGRRSGRPWRRPGGNRGGGAGEDHLSALRDRLTDSLYGLGWAGVKKLPEPAAAALGRQVADTAWRRRGKGVRGWRPTWPGWCPTPTPARLRRALTRRACAPTCATGWSPSGCPPGARSASATASTSRTCTTSPTALASGRGVILALPHMGNWDLAGAWGHHRRWRRPFTTVAERLKPETLYDRFVAYRESLGMEVLPHSGGVRVRHAGAAAAGRRPGLPGRRPRPVRRRASRSTFFGEATRMPAGPALLAQQTGALLLPVTLWYDDSPRDAGPGPPAGRGARDEGRGPSGRRP